MQPGKPGLFPTSPALCRVFCLCRGFPWGFGGMGAGVWYGPMWQCHFPARNGPATPFSWPVDADVPAHPKNPATARFSPLSPFTPVDNTKPGIVTR